MATSVGKKVSVKFEVKNKGDLGGFFIIQVSGMEYAVNNYIEGVSKDSLYLSAYISPSLEDVKIIKRMDKIKKKLSVNIKEELNKKLKSLISYVNSIKNDDEIIDLYKSNRICSEIENKEKNKEKTKRDYLSISIQPEVNNMIAANGMLLSVVNTLSSSLTARVFSSVAARRLKASSRLPHKYVCHGSSGFNTMSTTADPSSNLDIGIRIYRNGVSRGADRFGAGGEEYVNATGGNKKRNWRLRVYQAGNRAGSYWYDAKWGRTY